MSVLERVGLRTPLARDVALAVGLAVVTAGLLVPVTGTFAAELELTFSGPQRAWVVGLAVVQSLAVALRRARPALCLVLVAVLQVLLTVAVSSQASLRGPAPLIAFYTAGTCLPLRRLLRWAGVAVVVELAGTPLVGALLDPGRAPVSTGTQVLGSLSGVLVYAVAVDLGYAVATRRENLALLRARAETAERDREVEARRAVEAERLRMARELHDVAAHHLTGLLVQASAAQRLVARDDAAARDALAEVRTQGKQALDSLRAVVGVLRHDAATDSSDTTGADGLEPTPGLAVLPRLVATARALGDDVGLETSGTPYALTPVGDVTAYRVTQEALSNARQHAAGRPVLVRLAYDEEAVVVTVRNELSGPDRASGRDGYGLAGMHERAALAGGRLEAGPVDGPAWRVTLTIPRARVSS